MQALLQRFGRLTRYPCARILDYCRLVHGVRLSKPEIALMAEKVVTVAQLSLT